MAEEHERRGNGPHLESLGGGPGIDGRVWEETGSDHTSVDMQAIKAPQVVQPSYVPKLNSVEHFFQELCRAIKGWGYLTLKATYILNYGTVQQGDRRRTTPLACTPVNVGQLDASPGGIAAVTAVLHGGNQMRIQGTGHAGQHQSAEGPLQPNGDLADTWSGPPTPKLMAPFPASATGHPRIHATIQQDGNKLHCQTQFRAGAYAVTTAFAALQARGSVREWIPTEQQCSIERCTNTQCRHMVQPQASSATLPFPQQRCTGS